MDYLTKTVEELGINYVNEKLQKNKLLEELEKTLKENEELKEKLKTYEDEKEE